jgi:GNAT superfamily N-acetyltransferase
VPDFTIHPLVIPASIDADDAADFIEYSALDNLVYQAALGSTDFDHEAVEELPDWRIPGRFCEGIIAKIDGRIVGAGVYAGSNDSADTQAYVCVDPGFRRRGIGSALFERIVERARTHSRLVLQGHLFDSAGGEGDRVDAVSGVGSISSANPGLAFVLARGGVLEQVGRVSRVALPLDPHLVLERDEAARSGYYGTYELIRWEGRTPDEFLDDIAMLITRMSTDPPAAGLERPEDRWDADRLRAMEAEFESSPRRLLVVAARELATGRLVGYTLGRPVGDTRARRASGTPPRPRAQTREPPLSRGGVARTPERRDHECGREQAHARRQRVGGIRGDRLGRQRAAQTACRTSALVFWRV